VSSLYGAPSKSTSKATEYSQCDVDDSPAEAISHV
jgi:hypothetical protein